MKLLGSIIPLAALASATALQNTIKFPAVCTPGTETINNSTTVDGVVLTTSTCQTDPSYLTTRNEAAETVKRALTGRDINLCGAPCTTYCNGGTGGPNPNDCTAIANALDAEGSGFVINPGQTYSWSTSSCLAYIINTDSQSEYYCYDSNDLGGVINYLAWNCQASSSGGPYLGGSCHFYDNTGIGWVQVETS